ncbi:3-oxoacyl-[acyl-carrier-protein] synthase 3 [Frankliniella fusca]|uniref:3-oxoacyl-[acyl-carrier-protein] synthase 3 n=1 Tax=Frankliniella fusca TaxID=407009 RepID=A0AAE1LJD0_9NEOP|nr:3-oxoacyl-[acyl-carrier-protein] synthase 3 [Frankliniella fusca]
MLSVFQGNDGSRSRSGLLWVGMMDPDPGPGPACYRVVSDGTQGRHCVADRLIRAGSVIIAEEPLVVAPSGPGSVVRLVGVRCHRDPAGSLELLQRAAPIVERLKLYYPREAHLRAVHAMPRLRRLERAIRAMLRRPGYESKLALSAETLDSGRSRYYPDAMRIVERRAPSALEQSSCSRAIARSLQVSTLDAAPPELGALPPGHSGLRWLSVDSLPRATLQSLLQAHGATLEELVLEVGVPAGQRWPFSCSDLHSLLGRCGLRALRRLVLLRWWSRHTDTGCREQRAAVRAALPGLQQVLCNYCDDVQPEEP